MQPTRRAQDLYSDESAKNPAFKKIYTEWNKYLKQQNAWFSYAEAAMDGFMQQAQESTPRCAARESRGREGRGLFLVRPRQGAAPVTASCFPPFRSPWRR